MGEKNLVVLETVSAKVFGFSSRHYRRLADEGKVPPVIAGKVDFVAACKQIIDYYRVLSEGAGDPTYTDEKRLKTKAERKMKEIELAVMEAEFIPKVQVVQDLCELFINLKTSLRAWAKSLPPLLVDRTGKEIGLIILNESDRILTDLANGLKELKGAEKAEPKKRGRGRPKKFEMVKQKGNQGVKAKPKPKKKKTKNEKD